VEGYTDESIGGLGGSVFDIDGNRCDLKMVIYQVGEIVYKRAGEGLVKRK